MSRTEHGAVIIKEIELTPLDSKGALALGDEGIAAPKSASAFVRYGLFAGTVLLPLAIAAIYFFLIAANRYVSEAHFVIRSSATAGAAGVSAMIENQGLSRANDETYAVNDYLTSRDIADLLARNDGLRAILARPEADFINRFPNFYTSDNRENLYERYKSMVSANIDSATGISTLEVEAFRPGDAHALAAAILGYAESLINQLNERAYDDAERYAQSIVDRERANIQNIETRLTSFRNTSGTVDPGKEAVASFDLVGRMTTDLAMLQAQLQQQSMMTPSSPGLPEMRERIRSYQAEIDKQKLAIVGNNGSLATKLAGFERLELERELAARSLGLAMVNLTKAREDARQQHLYLQTIVAPNVSDDPDLSRRIIGMFVVLLISLAVFTTARTLGSIMLEHKP